MFEEIGEEEPKDRLYVVQGGSELRLVLAQNQRQAIKYVAKGLLSAHLASTFETHRLANMGIKTEQANPEPQEPTP